MSRLLRVVLGAVLVLGAQACNKDLVSIDELVDNEVRLEAARDSLLREGGRVIYTVHIVDGGKAGFANASVVPVDGEDFDVTSTAASLGVAGVEVTTSQLGVVTTVTTDENGMAVFPDMRIGKVAVSVLTPASHTSASFTAELTPSTLAGPQYTTNVTRHAATRIPVFPLTGDGTTTVSGVVTMERDLTNETPEAANGVAVSASITTGTAFTATYINQMGTGSTGQVLSITYGTAIASTTTSATGAYSLTLPATANGLPVTLHVSDVAADQTLLVPMLNNREVFGPQTIRTTFTQTAGVVPTTIPAVRPAYIEIDAPDGTGINQAPNVAAAATAVISDGHIVSVNITNAGKGYTQAPRVVFTSTTGTGAAATAVVTDGRITEINVTNSGSGYQAATVALVPDGTGATATAQVSFEVTGINVTNAGNNYLSTPAVSITGGSGSGATAVANMLGFVHMLNVTNAGINFTQVPTVQITGGGGTGATGTVTLNPGPIRQINVPASADVWFTTAPAVTFAGADGSDATATATLLTAGRLQSVTVTNAGTGYTTPPTVTFTGGGGTGAVAVAVLGAGGTIVGINLVNRGSGYTAVPTVTITGGGGTGATAEVPNLEFKIASVTITNGGHSYTHATNGTHVLFDGGAITGTTVLLNRSIASIAVGAGGTNYTSAPTVTIIGDGTGAAATATLRFVVNSITVTNRGSGYLAAPTVTISGGDGTGATATATLGNGRLTGITIINPGSGYTAPPNVILSAGGPPTEHAVVTATVTGGSVTGLTINSPGVGYTANPTVTISTFQTAAAVNANIAIGTVVAVNVTAPGLGYKAPPVIDFAVGAANTGAGASAVAVLDDQGRIERIDVLDGGANYNVAPTVNIVVPNSATRAKGTVTVNAEGVVTGVTITVAGVGYSTVPTVTILPSVPGVGSGATAVARIANGAVTGIVIVNGGNGYLGRNTPGNFFPDNVNTIAGLGFRFSQPTGATMTLRSGVSVVNDVYLGTGVRSITN